MIALTTFLRRWTLLYQKEPKRGLQNLFASFFFSFPNIIIPLSPYYLCLTCLTSTNHPTPTKKKGHGFQAKLRDAADNVAQAGGSAVRPAKWSSQDETPRSTDGDGHFCVRKRCSTGHASGHEASDHTEPPWSSRTCALPQLGAAEVTRRTCRDHCKRLLSARSFDGRWNIWNAEAAWRYPARVLQANHDQRTKSCFLDCCRTQGTVVLPVDMHLWR